MWFRDAGSGRAYVGLPHATLEVDVATGALLDTLAITGVGGAVLTSDRLVLSSVDAQSGERTARRSVAW